MTENVPPSQAPASAAATDQPGRPYYEHLRTVLRSTIEKKRKLDEQLAALEEQIYKTEGSYLEETSGAGNIVRGFDGWVKGVVIGGRGDDRRRGRIREEDRIFSRSSMSWMRVRVERTYSKKIADACIAARRTWHELEHAVSRAYAYWLIATAVIYARKQPCYTQQRDAEGSEQEEEAD